MPRHFCTSSHVCSVVSTVTLLEVCKNQYYYLKFLIFHFLSFFNMLNRLIIRYSFFYFTGAVWWLYNHTTRYKPIFEKIGRYHQVAMRLNCFRQNWMDFINVEGCSNWNCLLNERIILALFLRLQHLWFFKLRMLLFPGWTKTKKCVEIIRFFNT